MKLLKEEHRQDDEALRTAIMAILYRALEDAGQSPSSYRYV
jgi:hypothetical protein